MKPHSSILYNSISYGGGRKRIFIGLLCAACVSICLILFIILILPWLAQDPGYLRYLSVSLGILGIASVSWLGLMLVFHIYTGKNLPGITGVRHALIGFLLPMMELLGKWLGVERNLVRRSFIKVNNEFVLANSGAVDPKKLLLLLPHCIQASACPARLIYSLENCKNCGCCQIGAMRELAMKHGFRLAIATGGTIARRIVVECRPERIIAVACERDLTSGIQDSYPIPVFGVLNERPQGPCRDTLAPMRELENALSFFLGKEARVAQPKAAGKPLTGLCQVVSPGKSESFES